ncbi:hypothetical protein THAOC_26012, partial [Thalassiosira oceanica]
MLHQQNRQNDRGPDEATTEGLGPWNRVASGPESSSTESSDLAMGDAVSRAVKRADLGPESPRNIPDDFNL